MLGTLDATKKSNWKAYVPTSVHAYNATRNEATGFSTFYLIFGRQPSERQVDVEDYLDFTKQLRERLESAHKIATAEGKEFANRHNVLYHRRVRGTTFEVGDLVLVRNISLRGRNKLTNRWEDGDVYVVNNSQRYMCFIVQREGAHGCKIYLFRNVVLPVNFLPLPVDKTEYAEKRTRDSWQAPIQNNQVIYAYEMISRRKTT